MSIDPDTLMLAIQLAAGALVLVVAGTVLRLVLRGRRERRP
jgi:hypothetical protein